MSHTKATDNNLANSSDSNVIYPFDGNPNYTLQIVNVWTIYNISNSVPTGNETNPWTYYNASAITMTLGSGYHKIVFGGQNGMDSISVPPILIPEGKFIVGTYAYFMANQSGPFTLDLSLSYVNPSVHWNTYVGYPYGGDPDNLNKIQQSTYECYGSPDQVLVPRQMVGLNVAQVHLYANVVTAPVTFAMSLAAHSAITDLNGDRKVDMKDIGAEAAKFGIVYYNINDPLNVYDHNMDLIINMKDLGTVARDFGFQVPP